MRRRFSDLLARYMLSEPRAMLMTGDLGCMVLDEAFRVAPERCFNMGAAEQAMVGAAVGMSYAGKIPICYSISSFLLYRPFEWIRNYLHIEGVPVKLVGVGRDKDYGNQGYTHWCFDQEEHFITCYPGVRAYFPDDEKSLDMVWPRFLETGPAYLSLRRT